MASQRISSLTGSNAKAPYWVIRFFEILPGFTTWSIIILPIVLSIYVPLSVAVFIIAFDLLWLLKSFRMSASLLIGHRNLRIAGEIDWEARLMRLEQASQDLIQDYTLSLAKRRDAIGSLWFLKKNGRREHEQLHQADLELAQLQEYIDRDSGIKPTDVLHVVILATYNESLETLRPSIQALTNVKYDLSKIWFVIAYEERGGEADEKRVELLQKEFKGRFGAFHIFKHPADIVGEVKGKGPNISYAGKQILEVIKKQNIGINNVMVTTLDADHRPDPSYFNHLTYAFITSAEPKHRSYQPIPMFFNNIWDVPAPMRVIATGNSFWVIINTVRPHLLRNFAAHAQPLAALIDTKFWSVNTIVEDGHQFWRTFFRYQGRHEVVPIYAPIYQDAALASGYFKTFKNQYLQMQRWAYGASDMAYVGVMSLKHREIPLGLRLIQFWRLFEGHFSWATAPLILTFVAWLPLVLNPSFRYSVIAHQLPIIASQIMTIAMTGLFVTIWISIITLPHRPKRYSRFKNIIMIAQWVLLPVVALGFGSVAAIDSQTRLLLGKYLGFRVTEKAVKTHAD